MKVIRKEESIELCTESGWYAYDISTDVFINKNTIQRLGTLGSMTYLGMLSKPFYRIEQEYYLIKGLEGDSILRVAMLSGKEEILESIYSILESEY